MRGRDYAPTTPPVRWTPDAEPPHPPGDTSADHTHQVQAADPDPDQDATGPVEVATLDALSRLGKLNEGVRGPLAQMAIRMARAYDRYRGSDLTKLARLNQELRQTLAALVEVGDDDDGGEAARMSTPVWQGGEGENRANRGEDPPARDS